MAALNWKRARRAADLERLADVLHVEALNAELLQRTGMTEEWEVRRMKEAVDILRRLSDEWKDGVVRHGVISDGEF